MHALGYLAAAFHAIGAGVSWYLFKVAFSKLDAPESFIWALRGWLAAPIVLVLACCFYEIPAYSAEACGYWGWVVLLNVALLSLTFRALRQLDVGLSVHLRSFGPVASLLTAWLTLGSEGVPSRLGILGILTILLGALLLFYDRSKGGGPVDRFLKLFSDARAWLHYLLPITLVLAFLIPADKRLIELTNPLFGPALVLMGAWLVVGSFYVWCDRARVQSWYLNVDRERLTSFSVGLFLATLLMVVGHGFLYLYGYASSAAALKRGDAVVTVLLAHFLLQEGRFVPRLAGTLVVLLGAVLIGLDAP